jgi:outer membrane protein OmpA-like peptidoglycan-associated protein
LRGSRTGTLTINYWSTAPDDRVRRAQEAILDNIGLYLEGAIEVRDGQVGWKVSERVVLRTMEEVVREVLAWQGLREKVPFEGFSEDVALLLRDVAELDERDVVRSRAGSGTELGAPERLYLLITNRIGEVVSQAGAELGYFVNRGLIEQLTATEQVPAEDVEAVLREWGAFDPEAPLRPLSLDLSADSRAALGAGDGSQLALAPARPAAAVSNDALLDRVVTLLERQDDRLSALERDVAALRGRPVEADPELAALRLPEAFDVRFASGSSALGLNAQLQLGEVMDLLTRYPQLRVVLTGHTDAEGERAANLQLSRSRAEAVRRYLLTSGVDGQRVLVNYVGEEQAMQRGAEDRRVVVSFYAR